LIWRSSTAPSTAATSGLRAAVDAPDTGTAWIQPGGSEAGNNTSGALAAVGLGKLDIEERHDRSPWLLGMIVRPDNRSSEFVRLLPTKEPIRERTREGLRPTAAADCNAGLLPTSNAARHLQAVPVVHAVYIVDKLDTAGRGAKAKPGRRWGNAARGAIVGSTGSDASADTGIGAGWRLTPSVSHVADPLDQESCAAATGR
jgi:hypothetical protein